MSKNYIRTSKINTCPMCDDRSGKCRSRGDGAKTYYLCMNLIDAIKGDTLDGYKCIKENDPSKSYSATTWVLNDYPEWSEDKKAEWERQKYNARQQAINDEKAKRECCLSVQERDKEYRDLLAQLTLHPDDKADLLRRGLTKEEIERIGFKSVSKYHVLGTALNPRLPGVTNYGKQLCNRGEGYLVPVRNIDGLIVSCQIRLRNPDDKNRYIWLSSKGNTLHIYPNGNEELPLIAIHKPHNLAPLNKPLAIAVVEGTGVKPFMLANRLNRFVIGAAGRAWASAPNQYKEALDRASKELNSKVVECYPDKGSILDPATMNCWKNALNLLHKWGYKPVVKWWGQVTKNGQDIDELTDYSQIKDISVHEFFNLTKQPEVQQVIRSEKAWKLWRKAKQFTGDININSRYISDAIELPQSGSCVGINGGLGSGKTTLVYKLVQANPDKGFLAFNARNTLGRQFAGEADFYHLQDDLKGDEAGMLLLADPLSKIICCIDSIIHFYPEYFDEKILILDEFESTFKQLLLANTAVSQWRQRACYLLIEAFKRCDRVVILDGNLKDSTIASLEEIFANHGIDKKITKVKNLDNSLTSNRVRFYIGANQGDEVLVNNRSAFIKYLLENAGDSPFTVVSDSQIFLEALDKELTELGLKGLRIDSTTTNKPEVVIFLKNADAPKHWILENKPDYLLLSPSLENGGNINIPGYFKNIFAYFCGVLLTDEQLQILRRVRDSEALIHIFCKPVGLSSNSVSSSPFPHEIEHTLKEFVNDCANASFEGLDFKEALTKMIEGITQTASQGEFFKFECKLRGIGNHERFNLRECLRESLVNRGYKVELFSEEKTDDSIKNLESEVKDEKSKAIAESEIVTTEKAEEINRNPRATQEEKYKAIKRKYLDRLPGIENVLVDATETTLEEVDGKNVRVQEETKVPLFDASFVRMVHYDDRKMISRLETLHFLQHPEQAKILQQNRWYRMLEPTIDENPRPFNLSTGYRSLLLKINALNEIGITKFFDADKTWTSQDADVIKAWQKAQDPKISRAIGVKPGKDTPAAFVGKLLKSLGFKTESQGNKDRVYRVKESPFDNQVASAMLECIATRVNTQIAEAKEKDFSVFVPSSKPTAVTAPTVEEETKPVTKLECINGSLEEVPVTPVTLVTTVEEAIATIQDEAKLVESESFVSFGEMARKTAANINIGSLVKYVHSSALWRVVTKGTTCYFIQKDGEKREKMVEPWEIALA